MATPLDATEPTDEPQTAAAPMATPPVASAAPLESVAPTQEVAEAAIPRSAPRLPHSFAPLELVSHELGHARGRALRDRGEVGGDPPFVPRRFENGSPPTFDKSVTGHAPSTESSLSAPLVDECFAELAGWHPEDEFGLGPDPLRIHLPIQGDSTMDHGMRGA
jgi:hypothetical protein